MGYNLVMPSTNSDRTWLHDIGIPAIVTAGLFWTAFLLEPFTTPFVQIVPFGYIVGVVMRKAGTISKSPTLRDLAPYFTRWAVLFPATVFGLNVIGLWLLDHILSTPALRQLPIIETAVGMWTVWDATGLAILVVLTSGIGVLAALLSGFARAIPIPIRSNNA